MACDIWETQVTCLRSSFVYSVDRPWPWILPSFCGWTQIQWLGGCWIWRSVVNSSSCPESGARRFTSELELELSTREAWCFPPGLLQSCCYHGIDLVWRVAASIARGCGQAQATAVALGALGGGCVPAVTYSHLFCPCSSPLPYSEWPRASWPTGLPSLTLPVT